MAWASKVDVVVPGVVVDRKTRVCSEAVAAGREAGGGASMSPFKAAARFDIAGEGGKVGERLEEDVGDVGDGEEGKCR